MSDPSSMPIPIERRVIEDKLCLVVTKWRTRIRPFHARFRRLSVDMLADEPARGGLTVYARCECGAPVRMLLKVWRAFRIGGCRSCARKDVRRIFGVSRKVA